MKVLLLGTISLLFLFATRASADAPAKVLLPFGDAALWAVGLKEIADCKEKKCEEDSSFGIPQALKYALNNARIAVKHADEKSAEAAKKYATTLDKLLIRLEKFEEIEPGAKWDKQLKKIIKSVLNVFENGDFLKLLKDTKVVMEIPSDDIGLTFRSQSYDLPLYSGDDLKKGLKELMMHLRGGVKMPRIGFGTWMLEGEECTNAVIAALKAGYRHIDTAQSYENEKEVGKAIQIALSEGVINSREEIFLVTKLSDPADYSEKKALKAFEIQLEQLQTNYTDVYMLHGPADLKKNRAAWKVMSKLLKEGKIKALGLSNFEFAADAKKLEKNQEVKSSYMQNKFSIYNPGAQALDQVSMLQIAQDKGIGFVGYSILNQWPMALRPMEDPHVVSISKRYNRTTADVLHRWALQMNAAIIPRSKNPERIEENIKVLEFALGEIDMRLLNGLSVLAQSTSELFPPFVKDVYGLFVNDDDVKKSEHDEL